MICLLISKQNTNYEPDDDSQLIVQASISRAAQLALEKKLEM